MQQRITQITLAPEGEPIFAEGNYTITATDEGGGEFIEVAELQSADAPKIRIDKSEWPALRDAIDRMMGEVRPDCEAEATEAAWKDPLTAKREERERERQSGTEQSQQSVYLPDSVLRLVAIGIRAQDYALDDIVFNSLDLAYVSDHIESETKEARERVAELIAEARK